MPTFESLAAYSKELAGLERDLTGPEKVKITRLMGVAAQSIAAGQATRSLGADRAFSGWNRGAPIPLGTRLRRVRDGNTLLTPTFPGGWTVAEFGRHAGGGAGGFQGPSINRRSGRTRRTRTGQVSLTRSRGRASRWNGVTQGKGTASRAAVEMERRLPPVADEAVLAISRKRFDVT